MQTEVFHPSHSPGAIGANEGNEQTAASAREAPLALLLQLRLIPGAEQERDCIAGKWQMAVQKQHLTAFSKGK